MIKNNLTFSLKMETEPDFLGNVTNLPMLGVNQMFKPSVRRKSLVLSPAGSKYKKILEKKIKKIKEELNIETIDYPIMVYIQIYIAYPLTSKGIIDKRYERDVDNFFKPLQDALQGKEGIWKDDKVIKFISGTIKENKQKGNEFVISIKPLSNKTLQKIENIFLK